VRNEKVSHRFKDRNFATYNKQKESRKGLNCQSKHNLCSLLQALATCFGLNTSIIRPLNKTNSRYNAMPCHHTVLSLGLFCGVSYYNYLYNKTVIVNDSLIKGKGKAIPLQAWTGPEGFRRLRPQTSRQLAHEGGKVVSPTHPPPLPPRNYSWHSFLLEVESTPGP
jgi:hypothetical protein